MALWLCVFRLQASGCLKACLKCRHQLFGNPLCDRRTDGVSGSPSFSSVGRIHAEPKPIIVSRSLPLNHLMPASGNGDDITARDVDIGAVGETCKQRRYSVRPGAARFRLARYARHCAGVSHKLQWGQLSKTCDHEYPTAFCGDSEITAVQHAPESHIPALGKRFKHCLEVAAMV